MVAIALEVFREEVDEHEDWISEYGSIGGLGLAALASGAFEGRQSYAGRDNRCCGEIAADKNSGHAQEG
jgi:hypothetical protein